MVTQSDYSLHLFMTLREDNGIGQLVATTVIVTIGPAIGGITEYRNATDDLVKLT